MFPNKLQAGKVTSGPQLTFALDATVTGLKVKISKLIAKINTEKSFRHAHTLAVTPAATTTCTKDTKVLWSQSFCLL